MILATFCRGCLHFQGPERDRLVEVWLGNLVQTSIYTINELKLKAGISGKVFEIAFRESRSRKITEKKNNATAGGRGLSDLSEKFA